MSPSPPSPAPPPPAAGEEARPPGRLVAHLDMDAYFASVELLTRPELRGLPLVIGGRRDRLGEGPRPLRTYAGRGVVTTATYEARRFGIHSGMGLMKAAALAPEALLLPGDYETYSRVSRTFKAAVREIAPCMEDVGIDEIYLELTDLAGAPLELARSLQQAVREATGLSCSIGLAPNKLLAKIASDLQKPGGLTWIRPQDLAPRIWPLPASTINGVGPRSTERLQAMGIHTIGELAAADPALLVAAFGAHYGAWLHQSAHGRDARPLVLSREPKSLSRERTFERDLHPRQDREELSRILLELCQRLAGDLERKGCRTRSVGIKLRYDDFATVTRDVTLPAATGDAGVLREAARACLRRVPLDRRIRLLGLRAGTLEDPEGPGAGAAQPSLFEDMEGMG